MLSKIRIEPPADEPVMRQAEVAQRGTATGRVAGFHESGYDVSAVASPEDAPVEVPNEANNFVL